MTWALQAMTPEELAERASTDVATARRVVSLVHRGHREAPWPGVPRAVQAVLARDAGVPSLELVRERRSLVDPFRKLLLATHDGHLVETVRIPLERPGRISVCVSSQVGCALACAFCATGRMGLTRNLEAWEIIEQVRAVRRTLGPGERVHGVVFQGMGEPLANLDRVVAALRVLSEPSALAIDAKAITVCTSGLPEGIRRLAREAPRVRLGVSLGSARPEVRARLMPIARAHCFDEVVDALVEHAVRARQAPMLALTLLAGVTDTREEADALARLVADVVERARVRPRLSLIPYNALPGEDPFARPSPPAEARFLGWLAERGVGAHRRYSGGADVAAACGQLAALG